MERGTVGDHISISTGGNARVNSVVGKVDGDARFSSAPAVDEIRDLLDELRSQLAAAAAAGDLDPAEHRAAAELVALADANAPASREAAGKVFLPAIGRLGELVDRVADLSLKVVAIVGAVHGLP
jgi:hypothetical protein